MISGSSSIYVGDHKHHAPGLESASAPQKQCRVVGTLAGQHRRCGTSMSNNAGPGPPPQAIHTLTSVCATSQPVSVSRQRPGRATPSTNHAFLTDDCMGFGLHCCSYATLKSPRPVRSPEICGTARHHACPGMARSTLSSQYILCVLLLWTVSAGRCPCRHIPCCSGSGNDGPT
jgi:hypothetical protein